MSKIAELRKEKKTGNERFVQITTVFHQKGQFHKHHIEFFNVNFLRATNICILAGYKRISYRWIVKAEC